MIDWRIRIHLHKMTDRRILNKGFKIEYLELLKNESLDNATLELWLA